MALPCYSTLSFTDKVILWLLIRVADGSSSFPGGGRIAERCGGGD